MADGVRIENLNIGTLVIFPEGAPEGALAEELSDFLREQIKANALTVMGSDGYPVTDETAEPDDPPTPEEQESADQTLAEELIAAEADASGIVINRAKWLHSVAEHVTAARRLEGQEKGYASSPSKREDLKRRRRNAEKAAAMALDGACALCEYRDDCELTGDIKRWIDTHAYVDKAKRRKRRKDAAEVKAVESRNTFTKVVDAGVEAGEQVHCDPAKRTQV